MHDHPASAQTVVVNNGDVHIQCRVHGSGAPIILLHGIPDWSGGWHHQIAALERDHQLIVPNLRGFAHSSQPVEVERYTMLELVSDVAAIIDHFGLTRTGIVGHDIGGAIAWWAAMMLGQHVRRLAVLSMPHPAPYVSAISGDSRQQHASSYIQSFMQMARDGALDTEQLSSWVSDPDLRTGLAAALDGSSPVALANYYIANIQQAGQIDFKRMPRIKAPTMMIRGLADPYFLPHLFDQAGQYIDADIASVTLSGAGHFIHHDDAGRVNRHLKYWFSDG